MCKDHAKCRCCCRDAKYGGMCENACATNQCQYRDRSGERCKRPCREDPPNVMCVHHAG
jgi:hypothetical protein